MCNLKIYKFVTNYKVIILVMGCNYDKSRFVNVSLIVIKFSLNSSHGSRKMHVVKPVYLTVFHKNVINNFKNFALTQKKNFSNLCFKGSI